MLNQQEQAKRNEYVKKLNEILRVAINNFAAKESAAIEALRQTAENPAIDSFIVANIGLAESTLEVNFALDFMLRNLGLKDRLR